MPLRDILRLWKEFLEKILRGTPEEISRKPLEEYREELQEKNWEDICEKSLKELSRINPVNLDEISRGIIEQILGNVNSIPLNNSKSNFGETSGKKSREKLWALPEEPLTESHDQVSFLAIYSFYSSDFRYKL